MMGTRTHSIVPHARTLRPDRTHRILLVAYACSPGKGSEESVGWDTAEALARKGFRVTVLTRLSERDGCPPPSERPEGLQLACWDLPSSWHRWISRWGKIGVEIGYLAWLLGVRRTVRQLHQSQAFDSAQHVTYARYWMPSPLSVLDIPWILGPVGGGESIPHGLRSTLSRSGRIFEAIRDAMRWMGEHAPSVRSAVRSARMILANTRETAARVRALGAQDVDIINSAALADAEVDRLGALAATERSGFLSIGRLLDWKGFHLGLEAFARSGLKDETYTIIGEGPFRGRLEALAAQLGIAERVHFTGLLPREDVFRLLGRSRALVHPSLHESGGFVVLESMAAGTPVLCVQTGGPGLFVTGATGFAVGSDSPDQTVADLAVAMQHMVLEPELVRSMRRAAQHHVAAHHTMGVKADRLAALHTALVAPVAHERGSGMASRPVFGADSLTASAPTATPASVDLHDRQAVQGPIRSRSARGGVPS